MRPDATHLLIPEIPAFLAAKGITGKDGHPYSKWAIYAWLKREGIPVVRGPGPRRVPVSALERALEGQAETAPVPAVKTTRRREKKRQGGDWRNDPILRRFKVV